MTSLNPVERDIAQIFQFPVIYDTMSVYDNLAFPLKNRGLSDSQIASKVKEIAEQEGLHEIFLESGFDWREPGCSMCLAMNPDKLTVGERSASTSNRNFEGRQGRGGRTHLVSPRVAAASAIAGYFATPEEL